MKRHIFSIAFLLIISLQTIAQTRPREKSPFIDHISLSLNVGGDNFEVDKEKWQDQWKNQRTVNYVIDSFKNEFFEGSHYFNVLPKQTGLRIQLSKDFFTGSTNRLLERKLSLTAGLSWTHIKYRHKGLVAGDGHFFQDTTRTYINEQLYFGQQKDVLELNQALTYRFNGFFLKRMQYFFGIGYLLRNELNNKITEHYSEVKSSFNAASHRFRDSTVLQSTEAIKGKTFTTLQLFVPIGFNYELSPASQLFFEVDYTYSKNRFLNVHKKNDAWKIQLGYTYKFSR